MVEIASSLSGLASSYRGRHVLVTGGAGFIGSHIVDALLSCGARVRILDDLSNGDAHRVPPGIDWVQSSLNDEDALARATEGIELVFHQAAQINPVRAVEEPVFDAMVNVIGTIRLLEASRRAGVRKLVAASTNVYGNAVTAGRWTEDASVLDLPGSLLSPYAAAKVGLEAYLKVFNDEFGLPTVRLRYSNVFGRRQTDKSGSGVIAIFTRRALNGEALILFGGGRQTRDFVHVHDVARANLLAGITDHANGSVFNIANGKQASVAEIAEMVVQATGSASAIVEGPPRAADFAEAYIENSRARDVLRWTPEVQLADGVRDYVEWWQNRSAMAQQVGN